MYTHRVTLPDTSNCTQVAKYTLGTDECSDTLPKRQNTNLLQGTKTQNQIIN